MGIYTTLINEPIEIHLNDDWYDNGWSISEGRATHVSCNEGTILNDTIPTEAGETYRVRYTVMNWQSGIVQPIIGGTPGASVSANGTYVEDITAIDNTGIKFYSDGDLTIQLIRVSHGEIPAVTFSFDKNTLLWTSYWSYNPDMMSRFLDRYISWKDGTLWIHNANDRMNSFYGVDYPSIITFYCNVNYDQDKDFYTLTLNGSSVWRADVSLPARTGKSRGQASRIKPGNFKLEKGQWKAAFLRDMNDPRFIDEQQALMRGAYLQGQIMKITLTNNDIGEMQLISVEVDVSVK